MFLRQPKHPSRSTLHVTRNEPQLFAVSLLGALPGDRRGEIWTHLNYILSERSKLASSTQR